MSTPVAVDLAGAARLTGVSVSQLRRAIKATDPTAFPPPLRAKRAGSGPSAKHLIRVVDLESWIASFPDA